MKTQIHYEYIYFENRTDQYPKRKTQIWWIVSKRGKGFLGVIKWFGRWRQYCFFPHQETVYNIGCLNDIVNFIKQLHEERRNVKKKKR